MVVATPSRCRMSSTTSAISQTPSQIVLVCGERNMKRDSTTFTNVWEISNVNEEYRALIYVCTKHCGVLSIAHTLHF